MPAYEWATLANNLATRIVYQEYNKCSISLASFQSNFWHSSDSESSTSHDVMDNLFNHIIYFVVFFAFPFSSPAMLWMPVSWIPVDAGLDFRFRRPSAITRHTAHMYFKFYFVSIRYSKQKKNTHLWEIFHFISDGWTAERLKTIEKWNSFQK